MSIHQVRDGRHILRFDGDVLASGSSARVRATRWSEIAVYRLVDGYLVARTGYSTVAHRPECAKVNWRMTSWIDLEDVAESRRPRTSCDECQPVVGPGMDPQTMIETTLYSATLAATPAELARVLTNGKPAGLLPRLVFRIVNQCCEADGEFARYWSTVSPVRAIRTP